MIYIGSDHRGFELKNFLKEKLKATGEEVEDLGYFNYDPEDDYPEIAFKLGQKVIEIESNLGILICGSGAGVCFSANKVKGVRASQADQADLIKKAREDDDVNILCLAADFIQPDQVFLIVQAFLTTKFNPQPRRLRRLKSVRDFEKNN